MEGKKIWKYNHDQTFKIMYFYYDYSYYSYDYIDFSIRIYTRGRIVMQ